MMASIHRATAEDREAVQEFRTRTFGHDDPERLEWLYDSAPLARRDQCSLWTWTNAGRVEAQQGALLTSLRIGDVERSMAWALDLHVSPEHRHRGIGSLLPLKVLEEAEVVAGSDVSAEAQASFARSGWTDLGTVPMWVRPIRVLVTVARQGPRWIRPVVAVLGSMFLTVVAVVGRLRAFHYRLAETERFDEHADVVWRNCADKWPLVARRDLAWLSWRWAPGMNQDCRRVWLLRRDEILGWAVLTHRERDGLRVGVVLDFLCPPADLHALLSLVVRRFTEEHMDKVYCMFRAPGTERALRTSGFLKRRGVLTMMVHAGKLPPSERDLVVEPTNWYFTAGDGDLDRPRD